MPDLSYHHALFDPELFYIGFPPPPIEPVDVQVTMDSTWSPYVQASVTVATSQLYSPGSINPTYVTFAKLRLQQDFGDLVYVHEVTADYLGDVAALTAAFSPVEPTNFTRAYTKPWNIFEAALPLSTVTTAYAPVTPAKLTADDLAKVWKMSDFLHGEGTFNPAPSTIFDGYLTVRSSSRNYVTGETVFELASFESLLQDAIGINATSLGTFYDLRSLINFMLDLVLVDVLNEEVKLEPGDANFDYPTGYALYWLPSQNAWDAINSLVTAAGLVFYCDETGKWHLEDNLATSGDLVLKDTDNITALTTSIDRDSNLFFSRCVVEYRFPGDTAQFDTYEDPYSPIDKDRYFLFDNTKYPGAGAAEALVRRNITRGTITSTEAISDYNARPRQNLTIDVTDEPVKTAIVQSVSWSLPSARMSIDVRDLQEVI